MKSTRCGIYKFSLVIYYSVFVLHQYSQMPQWNWNCHDKNSSIQIYHEWLCFWIAKYVVSNLNTKRILKSRLFVVARIFKSCLHIAEEAHFIEYYITTGRHADISDHVVPILLHAHFGSSRNADSAAAATSKSPTQWPGVTTIDSPRTAEYRVVVAVMHDNPVIVYCSSVGI